MAVQVKRAGNRAFIAQLMSGDIKRSQLAKFTTSSTSAAA